MARAGVLAAGFLAQPIVAAISNETGIDILEVEPGDIGTDVKVTIGHEIAPGLVARFSRQFGQEAVRRGDDRVQPVAPVPAARDVLGRADDRVRVAVPSRRTRGDRPAPVFQLLKRNAAYSSSVSTRWAWTMPSHGDQANTVKRPSCDATSATARR